MTDGKTADPFASLKAEPVKELPKSGGRGTESHPIDATLTALVGKGPQRIRVGKDSRSKLQGLVNRRKHPLGLRIRTKTSDKPGEVDYLYLTVEKEAPATAS